MNFHYLSEHFRPFWPFALIIILFSCEKPPRLEETPNLPTETKIMFINKGEEINLMNFNIDIYSPEKDVTTYANKYGRNIDFGDTLQFSISQPLIKGCIFHYYFSLEFISKQNKKSYKHGQSFLDTIGGNVDTIFFQWPKDTVLLKEVVSN